MNGIDAEILSRAEVAAQRAAPGDVARRRASRCSAASLQRRAGTARHDAVAWGYARAADALGVDIIQNCEVTGFVKNAAGRRRRRRHQPRPHPLPSASASPPPATARCSRSSPAFALPVTSYALQAMVTEPVKPALDTVLLSPGTGAYVSQSDKGEMVIGASLDLFPSYAQRGSFAVTQSDHRRHAARSSRPSAACGCCASGPASSTWCTIPAPSSGRRRCRGSTSTAAGAPADSRRSRSAAGRSRTCWPPAAATSSPSRFSSSAFVSGRLIDEAAAAGIAH